MENLLTSFTNKIEKRLQQLEERLIRHAVDLDKRIDKIEHEHNQLATVIYDSILPAIKIIQKHSMNTSQNLAARSELKNYLNEISTILDNRRSTSTETHNKKPRNSITSPNPYDDAE